jgi:hypothetical protein
MKKKFPIIALALVVLLGGGFFLLRSRKAEPVSAPEPEGVLLETPLAEKPYVVLTPRADGKEFTLDISRIKNAKTIEYELVYLANSLSRGVIGSVDLQGETEISRKLLLGTCSRNVCTYDVGVEEGTLTLRFRGPEGVRKFVTEFHLQQGDQELTSVDGNFSLEGAFSSGAFYLTMATVGLPEETKGEVLAGPYSVFTAGSQTVRNGTISLNLEEENPLAKLYTWTGKVWQELEDLEIDGKTVSASASSLATFAALAGGE